MLIRVFTHVMYYVHRGLHRYDDTNVAQLLCLVQLNDSENRPRDRPLSEVYAIYLNIVLD